MADPCIGYTSASILCIFCSASYLDYLRKKRKMANTQPDLVLITQEHFDTMNSSIIQNEPKCSMNINIPPPKYSVNDTISVNDDINKPLLPKVGVVVNEYSITRRNSF